MNRDLKMKIVEVVRFGLISMAAAIMLAGCSSINSPANADPLPGQEVIVASENGAQTGEETVQILPEDTVEAESFELESTQTVEPSPTPTETPVEVFEDVVVPEGFSVGKYGMLRDPSTNKELITFNPEVDWQKFREDFIKGIWQYNMDWYAFTGEASDAVKYTNADAFYEAAVAGTVFNIGVPVRKDIDWENIDTTSNRGKSSWNLRSSLLGLKLVDASLSDIQIQIMEESTFPNFVGNKSWLSEYNEVMSTASMPTSLYGNSSQFAGYFSTDKETNLVISLGSYNSVDIKKLPSNFALGSFVNGIGNSADYYNISNSLSRLMVILDNLPSGELEISQKDGLVEKTVAISMIEQAVGSEIVPYFIFDKK